MRVGDLLAALSGFNPNIQVLMGDEDAQISIMGVMYDGMDIVLVPWGAYEEGEIPGEVKP